MTDARGAGNPVEPKEVVSEGSALLRGFREGRADRAFVEAGIIEIRTLLDVPALAHAEGVTASPGTISAADVYQEWAPHYDAPGNQMIDAEQPVVGASWTACLSARRWGRGLRDRPPHRLPA
ncbi:hypothetical protein ABZ464_36990 [Streptomyces sp. NPDC005820]|uniref:hypothetical protein n=1 Tax=Streptomyces sp. NPDC005820 TaxID=3157069 RepID=UPI0033E1A2F2